ncbi:hypothetical protein EDD18DRAFT_1361927 [Armillaria luteobubalina]|uniref:Uncharacterized protein n=1 Tax=Armillaria luteobubalina TaxID=153913 RepID=A0AA39ULT7_9AGAR|nr:hypothetical protein EDD18DRAFT_1361927 [Armillaria luteobubalina]
MFNILHENTVQLPSGQQQFMTVFEKGAITDAAVVLVSLGNQVDALCLKHVPGFTGVNAGVLGALLSLPASLRLLSAQDYDGHPRAHPYPMATDRLDVSDLVLIRGGRPSDLVFCAHDLAIHRHLDQRMKEYALAL